MAANQFSMLNTPAAAERDVEIERIVWFAAQPTIVSLTDTTHNCQYDPRLVYYNRATVGSAVYLPAGQYLVVGPRAVTYVGAVNSPSGVLGSPSPQEIVLKWNPTATENPMNFVATNGTSTYPAALPDGSAKIQRPLCIIVGGGGQVSGLDTGWPLDSVTHNKWDFTGANANNPVAKNGVGISISEPLFSNSHYYPQPKVADPNLTDPITTKKIMDWYGDPAQGTAGASTDYFLDKPLDSEAGCPLKDDNILATQTILNYKTVFLQRLANPWAAYDPVTNPYRTVDWMPIDLTVFNGEDKKPSDEVWDATDQGKPPTSRKWDPDEPNDGSGVNTHFAARQRGRSSASPADSHYGNNAVFNIWAQTSEDPRQSVAGVSGAAIFCYDLQHTLGYLNEPFRDPTPADTPGRTTAWITKVDNVSDSYVGDPWDLPDPADATKRIQWPWLTWSGRPYISEMELLLVPASHPARLLWEYGVASTSNVYSPYTTAAGANDQHSFPQMLNFFQSQPSGVTFAPNVQRLLEYVGVPSRYVGTEVQISPSYAIKNPGSYVTPPVLVHAFHPPFNRISTYREPGRINLNTISSPEVFYGLMNYFPGMATSTFWNKFVNSRRGYGATGTFLGERQVPNGLGDYSINFPTLFGKAFRGSSAAALQPLSTYAQEIDATVLRADPTVATQPLFEFNPASLKDPGTGLLNPTDQSLDTATANKSIGILATGRNAYFRYQGIERLGNLVTTRSNVFAVWITVGYFEVLPNSATTPAGKPDAVHPDGYELGQELGIDTGETVRHRAFYMFDRSIPVGFQRGQDLNQDKATLLRRYIE